MDCLFFDYDGTLLVDGEVSTENREAIRRVRALGHKVFLNTGRSRGFVPPSLLETIEFDGLCCGSVYCSLGGEVLYNRTMPAEEVRAICRSAAEHGIPVHLEGTKTAYTYFPDGIIPENPFGLINNIHDLGGMEAFLESPAASEIAKLSFVGSELPAGLCTGDMRLIRMNGFIEGVPRGYTKATPMEAIGHALGVGREHMLAFGDSLNDEDMLAYAGRCAVMRHAPEALDKYAPYRMRSVAEGVTHFYPTKK